MARKLTRATRRAMGITITPQKGCWLQYQLKLKNITQDTVAAKACTTHQMVTHFIKGRKNSERVKKALAEVLGYESFDSLMSKYQKGSAA